MTYYLLKPCRTGHRVDLDPEQAKCFPLGEGGASANGGGPKSHGPQGDARRGGRPRAHVSRVREDPREDGREVAARSAIDRVCGMLGLPERVPSTHAA
jgi:hypothetical protein